MSLMFYILLLQVLLPILSTLFILFMFLINHKKINIFLVKYLFKDNLHVFSYFLISMDLNKYLKELLNNFKEVYFITLCANKKPRIIKKKYINLNNILKKLETSKLNIYLTFQNTFKKNLLPSKLFLIIKPINSLKKNNLSKMFIRKSKFFAKTKYSWIRQECKSIVHLVLLFNITIILYSFATYMHWGIKTNLIFAILIYYNVVYCKSLFTIRGSINKILTWIKFYKRPQFLNKVILKTKFKKLLLKVLNKTNLKKKKCLNYYKNLTCF